MFPRKLKTTAVVTVCLFCLLYSFHDFIINVVPASVSQRTVVFRNLVQGHASQVEEDILPVVPNSVNPHDFKYVINNEDLCADVDKLSYVVYVHAGPSSYKRRQIIRKTWGQPNLLKDHPSKTVFFMGVPKNKTLLREIKKENAKYHDIVMEDFADAYNNMTYKAIAAFKWFSVYCGNTKYLLKVDDDIHVNIFRLITKLTTTFANKTRFFYCALWEEHSMPILRDPKNCAKWCVPNDVLPGQKDYPQYCSGSAYFFTSDVTRDLYNASLYTPYFYIDDVYATGLLPQKVKTPISFYTGGPGSYELFNSDIMKDIRLGKVFPKTLVIHEKQNLHKLWPENLKRITETEKKLLSEEKLEELLSTIKK